MSLVGTSVEQQIWNYLKAKGLNDCGVAGLMGNLYAESGLKPTNLQQTYEKQLGYSDSTYTNAVDNGTYSAFSTDKAGYGLAQWTYHTRKANLYQFAKSKSKSIGDLEMQLDFLWKELSDSYSSVLKTLKNASSVLEASNAVLLNYERPADQSANVQTQRAAFGSTYYNKYANIANSSNSNLNDEKYTKGTSVKISNNFSSTEFDCHGIGCCSETIIDTKLVEYLQKIRDHFGVAVTINSGYRCEKHNTSVGGATKSKHKYGQAADIVVKGITPLKVAQYAESIGILGIGQYPSFVHIDTRTSKYYWYGSNEQSRTTFGEYVDETNDSSASKDQATSRHEENATNLKVGDAVALVSGSKYTSGATPKPWVYTSTLYVRELNANNTVAVISTKNTGDVTGVVYVKDLIVKEQSTNETPIFQAYDVRVTANALNIRKGAGINYGIAGSIKDKGVYTIVAESTGKGAAKWGKLESGDGWIALDYCKKLN